MVLARWQGSIVDAAGNVIDSPFVEVRREVSGSPLAAIYSDRAGATPQANPFQGDAEGAVGFHVLGGAYRVRAYKGSFERTWRYVAIGTGGEADQGVLNEPGWLYEFESGTTAPPSTGFFRANNADLSLATLIWVSTATRGGNDNTARLLELDPGSNSRKNTLMLIGIDGGGASVLVDDASLITADYVALTISGHEGDTALTTDLYSLQREIAGIDGADSTVPGPEGSQGGPGIIWREDYSGATTYALNDVVRDDDGFGDPAAWISLQNANTNHTPKDNPTWWGLFPGSFTASDDYGLVSDTAEATDDYGSIA